jgi:hypothetical protein
MEMRRNLQSLFIVMFRIRQEGLECIRKRPNGGLVCVNTTTEFFGTRQSSLTAQKIARDLNLSRNEN